MTDDQKKLISTLKNDPAYLAFVSHMEDEVREMLAGLENAESPQEIMRLTRLWQVAKKIVDRMRILPEAMTEIIHEERDRPALENLLPEEEAPSSPLTSLYPPTSIKEPTPTHMDPNTLTDADVEKYVREIAAQEAAKQAADSGLAAYTPEPQPFKMTIGGQEMTFTSPEEASNAVNSALTQATSQREEPRQVGRQVLDDNGTRQWTKDDQSKYVDLLTTNPVLASEYVDEFRFGVKNPTELIRNNLQATHQIVTQNVIDRFVANTKDYTPTPENAAAMQSILTELGGGRPVITETSLEAAHAIAERRGLLRKPEQARSSRREDNPYLRTPPPAGRSTSGFSPQGSFEEQAENMTADQIETLFARQSR